ncbi:tyrosine recombinase XerD [mine drainage metagenome]|uniref:Tyrosine recombinase XerD n=1 Tax=mine drainage metagenome TaxID=410659 RepID=A0A1J5P863_9ZZZZ
MGFKPKGKNVVETFDYYLKRFKEKINAGKRNTSTLTRLTISKAKFSKYIKNEFHLSDIPLTQLKLANASAYCHFLETKEKLSTNTAMKHVKNLKHVIRFAIEHGWLESDPLMAFKCTYQDPDRERLTMEELNTIYEKEISISRVAEVRDVFIFSCYTGFAFIDAFDLTRDNLIIGIDGEKWLSKSRNKTETPETLPLLPIALEIVEKYKNHPYCVANNKLLPVNSNQRYNAYLKEIADLCEIKKNLTTHTARHTFATTVTLENDVPIETVSQMLGHKSLRTTQIYAKITQKKMSNNMKDLKLKLSTINTPPQILKAN